MNVELNPQQKKIISTAFTLLAVGVIISAVVLFFIFAARFLGAFSHVFLPLAVAGVLALVLEPWFNLLQDRLRLPPAIALVVVFLSLVVPLAVAGMFFGSLLLAQLIDLIEYLPTLWANIVGWFQERRPEIDQFFRDNTLGAKISDTLNAPGGPFADIAETLLAGVVTAGSGLTSGIASLMSWVVAPVYLMFFLLMPKFRPRNLKAKNLPFLKPETAEDVIYLMREFVGLVVSFFRGQIIISLIQGILFAIGFSLVGLEYGAVLGITLGFLNLVPYLGSMLGLAICLPMAWFQVDGGLDLLLMVIAVFSVVQMIEGYILTPRIMGDRTGLHPMAIIVAIFFWGSALGGILGMILAIPLTAFLVVLWRLAREKYIGQMF